MEAVCWMADWWAGWVPLKFISSNLIGLIFSFLYSASVLGFILNICLCVASVLTNFPPKKIMRRYCTKSKTMSLAYINEFLL